MWCLFGIYLTSILQANRCHKVCKSLLDIHSILFCKVGYCPNQQKRKLKIENYNTIFLASTGIQNLHVRNIFLLIQFKNVEVLGDRCFGTFKAKEILISIKFNFPRMYNYLTLLNKKLTNFIILVMLFWALPASYLARSCILL